MSKDKTSGIPLAQVLIVPSTAEMYVESEDEDFSCGTDVLYACTCCVVVAGLGIFMLTPVIWP